MNKLIARLAAEGKFDDEAERKYQAAVLKALRDDDVNDLDDLKPETYERLLNLQLELWPIARTLYEGALALNQENWTDTDKRHAAMHLIRESNDDVLAFMISRDTAENLATDERLGD